MLSRIELSGFKSFKRLEEDLFPLTVLAGLNGSGKSSLIQWLLFLKHGLTSPMGNADAPLKVEGAFDLGRQGDILYCYQEFRDAVIRGRVVTDGGGAMDVALSMTDSQKEVADIRVVSSEGNGNDIPETLGKIQYISAARHEPDSQHPFLPSKIEKKDWGREGRVAFGYLMTHADVAVEIKALCLSEVKDQSLRSQVDAWMRKLIAPGTAIRPKPSSDHENVELKIAFGGVGSRGFRPENVGFGISIVVPIIVAVLSAKPGDVLMFENPEAHLHPRGQAWLGRLLAIAAGAGVQIIVETHSDHVINGIRVAVKEGLVLPTNVGLKFFAREPEQMPEGTEELHSVVTRIGVTESGDLTESPDGFMDEWAEQMRALWV